MVGQHEDHGTRTDNQVSVWELISQVASEGNATRLANWPDRIVPHAVPPDEWPTGELPRIDELVEPRREADAVCRSVLSEDEDAEGIWGNRGPRPYQAADRNLRGSH